MGRTQNTSSNSMQRPVVLKPEFIEVATLCRRDKKDPNTPLAEKARTAPLRRCRADELALVPVATSFSEVGKYYPNFPISNNAILHDQRKPVQADICDDSLTHHLFSVEKELISGISPSTFLVYAGWGDIREPEWEYCDAATAWVLERNGKHFGATALHLLQRMDATKKQLRLYVANTETGRAVDLFRNFEARQMWKFTEVFVHSPSLVARQDYIRNLAAKKDVALAAENLDPEFQLALETTADICFFTFPDHVPEFSQMPAFKMVQEPPVVLADASAEYEEYSQTVARLIPAGRLLHPNMSVSIGKFMGASAGMATVVSTMEVMSSGAAIVNSTLQAFGVGVGSFYDIPEIREKRKPDWTLKEENNIFV